MGKLLSISYFIGLLWYIICMQNYLTEYYTGFLKSNAKFNNVETFVIEYGVYPPVGSNRTVNPP